jgi:hypothetical protein
MTADEQRSAFWNYVNRNDYLANAKAGMQKDMAKFSHGFTALMQNFFRMSSLTSAPTADIHSSSALTF